MKETYELIEARGENDTIEWVQIAIHFKKNGEIVSTFVSDELISSLDADSDEDIIIHSALNAIGSGDLRKIRKEAEAKFNDLDDFPELHFSKRNNEIEKVFVRLALIEKGLWSQVQTYFTDPSRTDKEIAYFQDATVWRKTNQFFQAALDGVDKKILDEVFSYAAELEKDSKIRDIFE